MTKILAYLSWRHKVDHARVEAGASHRSGVTEAHPFAHENGRLSDILSARLARILVDKAAIHGVLLSSVLFASRVYRLLDIPIAQPLLLGTYSAITLTYTVIALLDRRFAHVLIQGLYLSLIMVEMSQFAQLAAVPILPDAAFQYVLPTAFVVFAAGIEDGLGVYMLQMLLRYSFAYTAIYAVVAFLFNAQLVPQDSLSAVLLDDPERGERLYCFQALTTFAWFYCVTDLRRRPRMGTLLGTLLCGAAIVLTLSRVYIMCVTLVTAMWLIRFRPRSIRLVCLGMLWVVSLIMASGFADARWNPFDYLSHDTSGSVRMSEYDTTVRILCNNPIWGAGTTPTQTAAGDLTGDMYFAAGDLGPLGTWFDLGLLGLIVFFVGSHIVCREQHEMPSRVRQPMFLTGCLIAAYGCVGQTILYPPAGTFFAIVLAYWLRSRTFPLNGRPRAEHYIIKTLRTPNSHSEIGDRVGRGVPRSKGADVSSIPQITSGKIDG